MIFSHMLSFAYGTGGPGKLGTMWNGSGPVAKKRSPKRRRKRKKGQSKG